MSKISAKEVQDLKDPQLLEFVRNARRDQFNLRLRHATGELENTASLRTSKRALSRGLTEARRRNLKIESETPSG